MMTLLSRSTTNDMRGFLAKLEAAGRLRRIEKTVDRMWEPAAMAKWMFQAIPNDERFGMFFEHVAGSKIPLVIGALGGSNHSYALALGVEPEGINARLGDAMRNGKKPVVVASGSCQESVYLGADADLSMLPIPVWTPGKDAAPYLTCNVVTRDATNGVQNMGVYRTLVRDDHHVVPNLNPGRQGTRNANTYLDAGKPAPIAWVIAAEPAVHIAAVANLPVLHDEMDFAGGIAGAPIEMVKCKSIDLLVPANAEIVIEGEVIPGEWDNEGPFGEFAGYMGPIDTRPLVRITAITTRRNPIFYGYTSQMPPSESTVLQSLTNSGVLLRTLRDDFGELSVADVAIDLTFGGMLAHAYVAMATKEPAHAKRIGRLLAAMTPLKRITVVDADVDIRDPLHVEWAMNSCFNPARDTVIIEDCFFPISIDPSIRSADGSTTSGSKLVIDATTKINAGLFSLPSKDIMDKALVTWKEAGLPEFTISKRVSSRIARA